MSREPRTGSVLVRIDGLMFSRHNNGEGSSPAVYETGFLRADDHNFTICCETEEVDDGELISAERITPPQHGVWRFEILDASGEKTRPPDVELFINEGTPFDRVSLAEKQASGATVLTDPIFMDFRWVLDLEGAEFPKHPDRLILNLNKLDPLIQFPNGIVFNEALSEIKVERTFGGGKAEPFGAVCDIIGIDIDAQPEETLLLRNIETGDCILRKRIEKGRRILVNINNIPKILHGLVSHFQVYYTAIQNVAERYDIEPTPQELAASTAHDQHDSYTESQGTAATESQGTAATESHGTAGHTHADSEPSPKSAIVPAAEADVCGTGRFGGGGAPLCGGTHLGDHPNGLGGG